MATSLTDQQVANVQALVDAGDYPGAYNYLAEVNNALGADSRTTGWLDAAAAINTASENFSVFSSDSFYHHMVRGTTLKAANDKREAEGLPPIGEAEFQAASDQLAENVLNDIINNGEIPGIDNIISTDVAAAHRCSGF